VHANVLCELEVTDVQDGGEELAKLGDQAVAEADGAERVLELVEAVAVGRTAAACARLEVAVV
jgi:hypothetical protein